MGENRGTYFHWADYLLFGLTLGMSVFIGVFYAIKDRQKHSTESFLLGDRKIPAIPVAISIFASFMSAISILGTPSDISTFGTLFYGHYFSSFIVAPIAAHLFIPLFYRLKIKSVYQYLELRFNKAARLSASTVFMVQMMCYMSLVLYAPSLAFSQVTGIPLAASIVGVGIVCTVYTAIGGIKAVVWTDTLQMVICAAGLLAVVIQGTIVVGGFQKVWDINMNGSRIKPFNAELFDVNPATRYTVWNMIIGGAFLALTTYGANQAIIQRYLSVKSIKHAQLAVYLNIPCGIIWGTLLSYMGLVAYAYYHECDPLLSKKITKRDQMVPLMVMDLLGSLPGAPGLFLASVFSAALSTISSGVNSLAAVVLEDYIKPCVTARDKAITDKKATIISKILATFFGLLTVGLAFLPSAMSSIVTRISFSIFGMTGGPLLGMMVLGIFLPFSNSWGAIAGLFCGLATTFWIGIGSILHPSPQPVLPFRTDGCPIPNVSFIDNSTMVTPVTMLPSFNTTEISANLTTVQSITEQGFQVEDLYSMSYMWFAALGTSVAVLVGIIVSLITGHTKIEDVDPKLVVPIFDKLCCCLPERWRRPCRCGVVKLEENDVSEKDDYMEENNYRRNNIESEDIAMERVKLRNSDF